VTAAEVCKRVGVTRGAFHHHYPSVPSLLADALRHLYANSGTKGGPPPTTLTGLIRRHLGCYRQPPLQGRP